jgi:hypothetical protein
MALRRQTFRIIVAAIPILLLSAVAIFVMLRFLSVRDHLGKWDFILFDDKCTAMGHGELAIVPERWSVAWTSSYPWVTFIPSFDSQIGVLTCTGTTPMTSDGERVKLLATTFSPGSGVDCVLNHGSHYYVTIRIDLLDHEIVGGQAPSTGREAWAHIVSARILE